MISNKLLTKPLDTLYHKIDSLKNGEEVQVGSRAALSLFTQLSSKVSKPKLIIDLRNCLFTADEYSLQNHRIWSKEFKAHPIVINRVYKTAMVGPDNEMFQKEKELLENRNLRFFTDYEEATNWLEEIN